MLPGPHMKFEPATREGYDKEEQEVGISPLQKSNLKGLKGGYDVDKVHT